MDFSFSEEQTMLGDSVARFIDDNYDFETRQSIAASDANFSPEMWQSFAELGWTAVMFEEDDGGFGGGPVDLMLIMQQFGRGLVVEPFLACIVLAGGILRRAASPAQKEQWLPGLIEGTTQAALAFAEPQSRFNLADIATTAVADGDGYVINGNKTFVLNGGNADLLIIPARVAGAQTDPNGITLFAIASSSDGLHVSRYATVDGAQAAEISLKDVRVDADSVLGEPLQGLPVLRSVIDEATLGICAEAVGIIRTMHDKTVEYSRNRVQFGVPIGSFQALQHRMVETLIACEQCYSLLLRTVMLCAAGDEHSPAAISALKYQVGTAGELVAKEAVQIHGGMGVSWELDIAHYFKRMTAIDLTFGNADHHLDRYVALRN